MNEIISKEKQKMSDMNNPFAAEQKFFWQRVENDGMPAYNVGNNTYFMRATGHQTGPEVSLDAAATQRITKGVKCSSDRHP